MDDEHLLASSPGPGARLCRGPLPPSRGRFRPRLRDHRLARPRRDRPADGSEILVLGEPRDADADLQGQGDGGLLSWEHKFPGSRCDTAVDLAPAEPELLDEAFAEARFDGRDIEKLSLVNIDWEVTEQGYTVADEREFLAAKHGQHPSDVRQQIDADTSPSWREIERIYRALRKNHEDRNDRYGGHGWYFAEMEIGRRYADRFFTRRARDFYRVTSGYGLSPLRAAASFLVVLAVAFLLFMIPSREFCTVMTSAPAPGAAAVETACAGWQDTLRAVFIAASLQGAPEGISTPGLPGNAVWLLARFGGAAMLCRLEWLSGTRSPGDVRKDLVRSPTGMTSVE